MMTMNAPAAPSASPAVPVAATPANAPAPAANDVAAGDFLLMLGQLLGAPVTQTATTTKAAPASATDQDSDATDAAQDAAALTGVPIPFLTQMPAQPANTNAEVAGDLLPI